MYDVSKNNSTISPINTSEVRGDHTNPFPEYEEEERGSGLAEDSLPSLLQEQVVPECNKGPYKEICKLNKSQIDPAINYPNLENFDA